MICPQCENEKWCGTGDIRKSEGDGLKCSVCGWSIPEYVPNPDKNIWHPRDIEYFKEHPAPVYENLHRMHYTLVNSTIPFFGPMLYFLTRQIGAEQVLEIGIAEAFTSFYLANAVKDNSVRFQMAGNMYYGVDILDRSEQKKALDDLGLPNTIYQMDSLEITPETFKDVRFDLIFIDGNHDEEHIVHEFSVLWPQLKSDGYMIFHDDRGPGEEGCREVRDILKDLNKECEILRIGGMYGLMIVRKTEGFDENKRHWVP